jgi:hypothetical protein
MVFPEAFYFDIDRPLDARSIQELGAFSQRVTRRLHVKTYWGWRGLIAALAALVLGLDLAIPQGVHGAGANCIFSAVLIAWALALYAGESSIRDAYIARQCQNQLAIVPESTLSTAAAQDFAGNSKCAAYLQAVSAQKRELVRLELIGLLREVRRGKIV